MKSKLLYAVAVLALVSCKKELQPQESSAPVDSTAVANATQNAAGSSMQVTPEMVAQPQQQQQATAPGMNPPHGQPGHRCDIAVGAPLNSAPQTANQSGITVNPGQQPGMATIVPPPASNEPVKPGMNPPHGQPGHRCDIPVGQPLAGGSNDSKAAAAPVPAILSAPAEENPKE